MLLSGLILLAACANLGSLFAARAADRSREVALRLALGARRTRILRQLLTEALLISLAGGALGLWGSVVLLRVISAWRPFPEFPMNLPLNPDANVYALALLLAVVSGFLFGIVPVRQVLRTDPYQVIKSASAGSSAARGGRLNLRDVLLVMQISVCAVLVTSSIVAVRGLARSIHTRLGINPHNVLLVDTDPHMAGYKDTQVPALHRRMIDALKTLPGVEHVGLVSSPPLKMGWDDVNIFTDETPDLRPSNAATDAIFFSVSPEYFQAAGTDLLKGRVFTWNDDESAPHVAVINQEFARRLFGSPVARRWDAISGQKRAAVSRWWAWSKTENIRRTSPKLHRTPSSCPSCRVRVATPGWWCAPGVALPYLPPLFGTSCTISIPDCHALSRRGAKR
jgi:hypothetical protein